MTMPYDETPESVIRLETNNRCVDLRYDGTFDGLLTLINEPKSNLYVALKTLADTAFQEESDRRFNQRITEYKTMLANEGQI